MTLKDIEKYVKLANQLEDLKHQNDEYNNPKHLRFFLYETDGSGKIVADTLTELIRKHHKEYYGKITRDTEVENENGYLIVSVHYQDKILNFEKMCWEYFDRVEKFHLYIDKD